MSASLYDQALVRKFKNWIKDQSLTITSPDETKRLFQYKADTTDDKPISLPLIALRRDPTFTILNTGKRPLSHDGWRKDSIAFEKTNQLNAIPIHLNYQLDIYTRYQEDAEAYVRNFIFNIINYPKLTITIPYNDSGILANSNIRLQADVVNNSDIPERLIPGQFTRYTLSLTIDDAYLWDYRTKDNWKIDADSEVSSHLDADLKTSLDVKKEV